MQDLRGKVAVITGGASGIGFASAEALAREGAKLVLADVEAKALEAAAAKLRAAGAEAIGEVTDVRDRQALEARADATWKHYGRADIVFNNAGVAVAGAVTSMTHEDWRWVIDVDLWGVIHGVEAFVPRLVEQKQGGHVLNTASATAVTPDNTPIVATASAAVPPLALTLAKAASPMTYGAVGQGITYTYTVTNTGGAPLAGPFAVSDDHLGTPPGTPFACGSGPLDPGQHGGWHGFASCNFICIDSPAY